MSYPPSGDFNGIMVSDFQSASEEIFPKSKMDYIKNYRVFPYLSLRGRDLVEDMIKTAETQVKLAKRLFVDENWDLYFFYYGLTDTVLHFFWNDISDNTEMGQEAKRVYYIADEFIKWVSDQMDKEDILLLVSDHGFKALPYEINLNRIFMEKGLLKTRIKVPSQVDQVKGERIKFLFRQKPNKIQREVAVQKLNFRLANYYRYRIRYRMASISKRASKLISRDERAKLGVEVDCANSTAFVPIPTCVNMNIRETDNKKREETVRNIAEMLKALEYKGRRVFDQVLLRDEVYTGPFTKFAPDILLISNNFYISPSSDKKQFYGKFVEGGFHDLRGIFLAYGPNIRASAENLTNLKIYDVAPTILHISNLPVPEDMDGRVLKEIFKEGSELASREVKYQEAEAEEDLIRKRIKELKDVGKI